MPARLYWNPAPLTAATRRAVLPAAQVLGLQARQRAGATSKSVASSVRVTETSRGAEVTATDPKARLVEFGAKAHKIAPRGQALRLADGRFVSTAVKHPGMRATPFMRPLLGLWGETYRRVARATLSAAGFRIRV